MKQSTFSWTTLRYGAVLSGALLVAACSDGGETPPEPGDEDTDIDNADGDDDDDTGKEIDASRPPSTGNKPPATAGDAGKPAPDAGKTPVDPGTGAIDGGSTSTPDSGGGSPGPVNSGESACLDSITDFQKAGPFTYKAAPEGSVKIWVPDVPAGCKVPVVHLANGTGGTCSAYSNVLNRLASHGFLTTCYENTNTGAGTQGLMAFETAISKYPDLALQRFGSMGHSQGGQAAFVVQALAEAKFGPDAIYAGLAMEPASGFGTQPSGGSWQSVYAKIKFPMFMFSGTSDTLVSAGWVARGFDALDDSVEAYNWSARGATHVPTPQAETMEVSIPWFRWKLLGDKAACTAFMALKGAGRWTETKSQNPKTCE